MFIKWLSRVCDSHGWRVLAWVLMGNHFHLLLETPEANLTAGMRILMGAFGQAWNRRLSVLGMCFRDATSRFRLPVSGGSPAIRAD